MKRIFLFLLVNLLTACGSVYTTQPIVDAGEYPLDQKLAGVWAPEKFEEKIEDHPTNYYLRIGTAEDGTASLETFEWSRTSGRLTRHQRFRLACAPLEGGPVCVVTAPKRAVDFFTHDHRRIRDNAPHLFARYEVRDAGEVAVYYLSTPAVQREIKAGRLEGREYGPVATLDLPPQSLRKLVRERPELFVATGEVFRRIDESVFNEIFVSSGNAAAVTDAKAAELTTLMNQAQNGSPQMQYVAIEKLGKLGKRAEPAVPLLTEVLWKALVADDHRTNKSAEASSNALLKIGTASTEALRALEYLAAETSDKHLKQTVSDALTRLLAKQQRVRPGDPGDKGGASGN